MNQAVLANVEIARAGAAAPLISKPLGDIVLKLIEAGIIPLTERHNLFEDFPFARLESAELAIAVMNDADG
jgi:hypothetical protein